MPKGYNDEGKATQRYSQCSTLRQRKLQDAADAILAKANYFTKSDETEEAVLPADAVGVHGLRPTWHGKA